MPWDRNTITKLLEEAGAIAERVKKDLRFELKADRSIVTPADREIEAMFSRELERPDRGTYLIGEETVETKGEAYIQSALAAEAFVVDPIDGTAPFAHRLPNWGISIGRMEKGVLVDGAVYLPECGGGEIVLSDGPAVLEGTRGAGGWQWRELDPKRGALGAYGLIAVTQELAKHGRVRLPNPVMVLGAAVVPLLGLLQGRFLAYLGSVKLWDIAGALPLILRKGFAVSVMEAGERRDVTPAVEERTYHLDPSSRKRWALRSDLVIAWPEDEQRFRESIQLPEAGEA